MDVWRKSRNRTIFIYTTRISGERKKKQQQQLARMFALSHRHTLSFRYTPVHSTIATKNPYLPHSIPFHLTYIHPQCRRKNEFFLLPYQFIEANSILAYIFYIEKKKHHTHTHIKKERICIYIKEKQKGISS